MALAAALIAGSAASAPPPLPEFTAGEQCLFCHRDTVGKTWNEDRHQRTVRAADTDAEDVKLLEADARLAAIREQVVYILGAGERMRRLLKPAARYGEAELHGARVPVSAGAPPGDVETAWSPSAFGASCAGCHSSGYDTGLGQFQTLSIDCFACHGEPPLEHTEAPQKVLFGKGSNPSPRVVASACGQCHIRSGVAKSSGRPHPNNFVAGGDLFSDFAADSSEEALAGLHPNDRHVVANIRDIVEGGREDMTCVTCHTVHGRTTLRHRRLKDEAYCFICHTGADTKSGVVSIDNHSNLCEY